MKYKSGDLIKYNKELAEVLEVKGNKLIIEMIEKNDKKKFKEINLDDVEGKADKRNKKDIIKRR
jgi:hypothetical protein